MSFNLNYRDATRIAENLNLRDPSIFKQLSQKERRICLLALQNLTADVLPKNCKTLSTQTVTELDNRLKKICTEKSDNSYFGHFFIRLVKAGMNFFRLRISSTQLTNLCKQYQAQRSRTIDLIVNNGNPDKFALFISDKINQIDEMHKSIEHIEKISIPLVREMNKILLRIKKNPSTITQEIEKFQKDHKVIENEQEFKAYLKLLVSLKEIKCMKKYAYEVKINYHANQTRLKNYTEVVFSHEKKIIPKIYKQITDVQMIYLEK